MPQEKPLISGIIPIVSAHVRFLDQLVENLNESKHEPMELIVIGSGLSPIEVTAVKNSLSRFSRGHHEFVKAPLAPAGTNRNLGMSMARGRLLAFMDADDLFPADRLEILTTALSSSEAVAVVHNYLRFRSRVLGPVRIRMGAAFRSLFRNKEMTNQILDYRTLHKVTSAGTNILDFPLHHAHVLADAETARRVRFSDTPDRNEDALFLRAILEKGFKIIYLDQKLSAYYLGSRMQKALLKISLQRR